MDYVEEKVGEAQEHFQELLMFAKNNQDNDINFMEKEILQKLLKIGNATLQIYIQSNGTGYEGKKISSIDGKQFKHEGGREIIHTTIFGEVPIKREYYRNVTTNGLFPLDRKINLPERTYSYLLERFSMGVAVNDSYEEARKYVREVFGINIPQSSLQQLSGKASCYFEDYYKQLEIDPVQREELTIVSADGKGVPIRGEKQLENKKRLGRGEKNGKKKMSLVGTVYNTMPQYDREKRDFRPKNKKIWAFLKDKERTMGLLRNDVDARLASGKDTGPVIFLADGERGLWSLKEKYFPEAVEILDWYHMSEYLWKAVYLFYKEGSPGAKIWVADMERKMMEGRATDVVTGIKVRISKNTIKGRSLSVLKSIIEYFENNKERMKYNEYLAKGYPIGSGNVESACRYLVKDRMEKTGMRWTISGAQAILSLRSIYLNGNMNDYWTYYMNKENIRLYNKIDKCA